MNNKIIIINGPNLNLLGEREQSQYGTITFEELKEKCNKKAIELKIELEFFQSNIEGEIVNKNGSSETISVAVACSISLARSGIDLDRIVLDARATRIERATNMDD